MSPLLRSSYALCRAGITCCALLVATLAAAVGTPEPDPPPRPSPQPAPLPAAATPAPGYGAGANDALATARAHNYAGRYAMALAELRRINTPASADWNNLMGYALRKSSPPDLEGAQRHYDEALRLNPNHLGALEYSGELALMKKDLATAEARLARLQTLCRSPCEALDLLQAAITRHKAAPAR